MPLIRRKVVLTNRWGHLIENVATFYTPPGTMREGDVTVEASSPAQAAEVKALDGGGRDGGQPLPPPPGLLAQRRSNNLAAARAALAAKRAAAKGGG